MPIIETPQLTQELADKIADTAFEQLRESRQYKRPRLEEIQKSEELYFGKVKKQLKNPFNDSFPFMSGFVDHVLAKVDDPPTIDFMQQDESDYKRAKKIEAVFDREVNSPQTHAKWKIKDRWSKKLALFSGFGVYKIFGESDPEFKIHFNTVDYYDFHFDPYGGGMLENHLFCGEDNIYKTKEEIAAQVKDGFYDNEQWLALKIGNNENGYREDVDEENHSKHNRHKSLGLDPGTNNYTGQDTYKLFEWYLTYQGVRWQLVAEEHSRKWLRIKRLSDVFQNDLYPYVAWHTHEDPAVFFSKAACDDARPVAENINRLLNQELYNREKRNTGQRLYDPEMFPDLEALASWTPDGLIPVDTKSGRQDLRSGLFRVETGEISGSIDLVAFLDSFAGQKTASTPSSQGQAEKDKKVGIFFGEMQQIEDRLGLYNKSYKEAWEEIGMRFIDILDEHLNEEIAIQILGADGLEWTTFSREDLKAKESYRIQVRGGDSEEAEKEIENQKKLQVLPSLQTVDPKWRDRELMKRSGYNDEDIKEAYSPLPFATRELMSEAKQAIEEIIEGKQPKLNRQANTAFMQRILDEAIENEGLSDDQYFALIDYAESHAQIAARNEALMLRNLKREMMMKQMMTQQLSGGSAPPEGRTEELPARVPNE